MNKLFYAFLALFFVPLFVAAQDKYDAPTTKKISDVTEKNAEN